MRHKERYIAHLDEVQITREGDYAFIEYTEEGVPSTRLQIGPEIAGISNEEIVEWHNERLRAQTKQASEHKHVAVEVPPRRKANMLERFNGQEGRQRLVTVFADQELVRHNTAIAQQLAQVAELKEYKEEPTVYIQGRPGNNKLYFILIGTCDLLINARLVRVVESGQAVGEFPIVDPSLPYTVTIRAREPSVIATVLEHQFRSIAEQYPEIWMNMAMVLVRRLHATRRFVPVPKRPCVFIGHGHSGLWTQVQHFLQDKCRLKVVSFESEPVVGKSIVNFLKDMLQTATFAVFVLTAEDETIKGRKRARQNVVHEAGLFQGVLGFERAILLVQNGLEEFSNVDGLQHISFEADEIDTTFSELEKTLRREKQIS